MKPAPRRLSRRVILLAASSTLMVSASACLSPTLPPLPPPTAPVMTRVAPEEIEVRGRVPEPVAKVFVMNEATEQITGQFTETGTYAFRVAAQNGDVLSLWYTVAGELSDAVIFQVPDLELIESPSPVQDEPANE